VPPGTPADARPTTLARPASFSSRRANASPPYLPIPWSQVKAAEVIVGIGLVIVIYIVVKNITK